MYLQARTMNVFAGGDYYECVCNGEETMNVFAGGGGDYEWAWFKLVCLSFCGGMGLFQVIPTPPPPSPQYRHISPLLIIIDQFVAIAARYRSQTNNQKLFLQLKVEH